MGRTPAQDGTWPEKRNQVDSAGVVRDGESAATSVDDFMWYHQNEVGKFDVASLARMSRAIVRHSLSFTDTVLFGDVRGDRRESGSVEKQEFAYLF
eukprot:6029322-Pleurochrysis_carterae.AAC.1